MPGLDEPGGDERRTAPRYRRFVLRFDSVIARISVAAKNTIEAPTAKDFRHWLTATADGRHVHPSPLEKRTVRCPIPYYPAPR